VVSAEQDAVSPTWRPVLSAAVVLVTVHVEFIGRVKRDLSFNVVLEDFVFVFYLAELVERQ